jgi:hypothetical protein
VRKISAIVFLSIYLLSATEISQLLKLPKFIEHIREHRAEDSNISLWKFLCIHYGQGNVMDADYDEDMKLPFKAENNTAFLTNAVYFPLSSSVSIVRPTDFPEKRSFVLSEEFLLSSYLSNIWQPPRFC